MRSLVAGLTAAVIAAVVAAPVPAAGFRAPGRMLVRERASCRPFLVFNGKLQPCESTRGVSLSLRAPSGRLLRRYRIHRYVLGGSAVMSPDGRTIAAYASPAERRDVNRGLLVVSVASGRSRWLVRPQRGLGGVGPTWSADAAKILYERDRQVQWMIDARTGADARVPLPQLGNATQYPLLLPEGDVLFAAAPDHPQVFANAYQFFRVPITGAPATPVTPELDEQPVVADISPDGRSIAFLSQSQVWVVPIGGGDPRIVAAGPAGYREDVVRWAPDGTHLAVIWESPPPAKNGFYTPKVVGEIVGLDGSRLRLPIAPEHLDHAITWSPDARYVAYDVDRAHVGRDGFGTRIVVVSAAGRIVHASFPRSADSPQWLPR